MTATPKRGDGKEKINEFLLGPIRYRFTAKDRAQEQQIDHLVYPRVTRTVSPHRLSKQAYTILNPKGTSVALAANEVP